MPLPTPIHHDDDLTEGIIGAAIAVHRHLGPGLLESAYRECLVHELRLRAPSVPLRPQWWTSAGPVETA